MMSKNIFLLIFLILVSSSIFSQNKTNDPIPDRKQWDKTKKNTKELNEFLSNPLDLQVYKKLKTKRSNSGGGSSDNYLYKPNYNGFYYGYFFFYGYHEHGPRITTYKKGRDIGGYMDTSEVFIQLSCDALDKDLGKANILSFTTKDIIKKFGDNYLKKDNTLVYQYNKTILIISHSSNHVWFKISKLNKTIKKFAEMEQMKNLISYF